MLVFQANGNRARFILLLSVIGTVLFNVDIAPWEISSVRNTTLAFQGATSLKANLCNLEMCNWTRGEEPFVDQIGTRCARDEFVYRRNYCAAADATSTGIVQGFTYTWPADVGFADSSEEQTGTSREAAVFQQVLMFLGCILACLLQLFSSIRDVLMVSRDSKGSTWWTPCQRKRLFTVFLLLLLNPLAVRPTSGVPVANKSALLTLRDNCLDVISSAGIPSSPGDDCDLFVNADTSLITDMEDLFLSKVAFNGDISGWNISSVTTMREMFRGASAFNANISRWDTSSVTTMQAIFQQAVSFDGDISNWDTSKATTFQNAFNNATSFNADISKWDTSSVTDMNSMFFNAAVFNADISGWDTNKVTDMSSMFRAAADFNTDIAGWDISSVTTMQDMFLDATAFDWSLCAWNGSSATGIDSMFGGSSPKTGLCCRAGTYADATNFCAPCPAQATCAGEPALPVCAATLELAGDGDGYVCACDAGYTGSAGGPCTACVPGSFKAAAGSDSCEVCAANSYTDLVAATACTPCPTNTVSEPNSTTSTSCLCDRGTTGPDGGNCTFCPGGSFKGVPGTAPCYNCSAGFFATAGASTCSKCEPGDYSWDSASVCLTCSPLDVLTIPQCLAREGYGLAQSHCCWEPELGCGAVGVVLDDSVDCAEEVENVDAWVSGPFEIVVSWSLPETEELRNNISGYNLVIYDASLGYDAVPPYSTYQKRMPGEQYDADLNHYVAPCRVWSTFISGYDGTGLWEEGAISRLAVVDSGLGAGPGNLSISSAIGEGFRGSYEVCEVPWNEVDVEGEFTGRSTRVCNLTIADGGQYYFREGMVDVSFPSDANETLVLSPRISYEIQRGVSSAPCTSVLCRPAFVLNNITASRFNNSLGIPFEGLRPGREYAFAVIPQDYRGFGKFPAFDAEILSSFQPGGWSKQIALSLASAPTSLALSSCLSGEVAVTWALPRDLGALTEEARRAAATPLGRLWPFSALDAIGGSEGVLAWHVQVSTMASYPVESTSNYSLSVEDATVNSDNTTYKAILQASPGSTAHVRVRVETAAGLGAWAEDSIAVENVNVPSPPPVAAQAWHEMQPKVEVYWWVPYDTGQSNGTAKDLTEPIISYTVRLQGTVVYSGMPSPSEACGLSFEGDAGDGVACCVQFRPIQTTCGGTSSVCERLRLSLSGSPLGVRVEAGGVYNVTVTAKNEVGDSEESYVRVQFGTARDMWARPAARCTTSRLVECAEAKEDALCAYSNQSRAWCNTRPGVVSEFGALGFEDEDECDSGTHNCDDNAECINTDGSFACPCNEGYHNVGAYACADDDECASGAHACAPNAACLNTDGNYTCVCAANFFGSGESNCTACPYDLVSPQNSTTADACACPVGYNQSEAEAGWCSDADECSAGLSACDSAVASCENTQGSYTCLCALGYYGDGLNCTACPENSNTSVVGGQGLEDCQCSLGYVRVYTACFGVQCKELDECAAGVNDCGLGVPCENTVGSFQCFP